MFDHDVVIIGGGLAGSRAALEIARTDPSLSIALVAKTHPIRSHSVAAQGGIASSLQNVDPTDSWEAHAFDTVKGGDYLADQDAVEILTREAPDVVIDLEHMGVLFSRLPDGRIAQRAFGGHSHNRTCYAADKTGHAILHELICNLSRYGVQIYEEWYALRLVLEEGEAKGVVLYRIQDGQLAVIRAKAVMFATGGYGRVYNTTSNDYGLHRGWPVDDGAGGVAAGGYGVCPVPSHGAVSGGSADFGGGAGRGRVPDQQRRAAVYGRLRPQPHGAGSPRHHLQSHDSRNSGGPGCSHRRQSWRACIYLDLRHMGREKIMSRVPFCWEEAHRLLGIDAVQQPMPVRPTVHYSMGGIPVTTEGRVCSSADELVEGFFAAGKRPVCRCMEPIGWAAIRCWSAWSTGAESGRRSLSMSRTASCRS